MRITRTCLALLLGGAWLGMLQAQADTAQQPVDPNLRPPHVEGLQGNALDPESVSAAGLNITVEGLGIDNTVVLPYQTALAIYLADAQGQTLTSVDWPISARNAGKPVTLPLEKRYLEGNIGKTLQVYYILAQPRSAPKRSAAVVVQVKEGFAAAQTLDLTSRNYIVFSDSNGVVRPPPRVPGYAQLSRVQPGALQYTSDNDAVARVDGNGQVSVWGNGTVTITATTAAGTAASYVLTVRGVRQLELLSAQYRSTWEQARTLASAGGYRLPSDSDFQALLQLYPTTAGTPAETLDLAPYWVWGQAVGAGTAVYLDLNDGLVTSGHAGDNELGYPAGIR